MSIYMWKEVPVSLQSAIAAEKTISGITQANPGVVTCTAHGYSNGDIVVVTAVGMREVNERVFRVANVTTDSFQLEGEDTSDYSTFTSGTVAEVTMGTSVTTIKELSPSGGDFDFKDATTIHGNARVEVPGLPSAMKYNMTFLWDPKNTAHKALERASTLQQQRVMSFGIGTITMYFLGYVGFQGAPGGGTQDVATCTGVFTLNGRPTYYE